MRTPWLVYAGIAAGFLPLLAVLLFWRRPRGAAAWILGWAVVLIAEDALAVLLAELNRNNHWLNYVAMPTNSALVLWALSLWQAHPAPRRAMRIAIPIYLLVWTLVVATVENPRTFSTAAQPLAGLLGLAVAAYTLVARSLEETEGLTRQDWFWTCGGLTLYFGIMSTVGPLAALLGGNLALLARAYELKSVVDVVAFLAIARGITCRTQARPSGVSSSPASSPSALSSSLSALR